MPDLDARGLRAMHRLLGGNRFAADWIHEPPDWTLDALCAQFNPDDWHVEKGESTAPAKMVCARCEVRGECLAYAMGVESADYTRYGVYGGLSAPERRELSRSGWRPDAPLPAIVLRNHHGKTITLGGAA